jgi:nucleoside-diphosphate-sugar epimerase
MDRDKFYVTGGTGCIGSWVVKNLIDRGLSTSVLTFGDSCHRLQLIMDDEDFEKINYYDGDITDYSSVINSIKDSGATKIIHLAALQLPFCKANPQQGADVNVTGTINIFEAAKAIGIDRIIYASSTAVYGPRDLYPEGQQPQDAKLHPISLYGVYKQANEWFGGIYSSESNISSIGLRPYTVYGPGRDQGMTSTPTKAILAALVGEPYEISFGGEYQFQYADDVAKIFIQAAESCFVGSKVFNIGGEVCSTQDVIDAITEIIPASANKFSFNPCVLPFPSAFENSELISTIGDINFTPLSVGIENTLKIFKEGMRKGIVDQKYIDSQLSE